jgi:hypothetical protein
MIGDLIRLRIQTQCLEMLEHVSDNRPNPIQKYQKLATDRKEHQSALCITIDLGSPNFDIRISHTGCPQ